jgi:hypothetical protein
MRIRLIRPIAVTAIAVAALGACGQSQKTAQPAQSARPVLALTTPITGVTVPPAVADAEVQADAPFIAGHIPLRGVIAHAGMGDAPGTTTTTMVSHDHSHRPSVSLASHAGSVSGTPGSSCWKSGNGGGLCMDSFDGIDPEPVLVVNAGEPLTLHWDREDAPRELQVQMADRYDADEFKPVTVAKNNPTTFAAPTTPRSYWIIVSSWWPEGDSSDAFEISVSGYVSPTATGSVLGSVNGNWDGKNRLTLTAANGASLTMTTDQRGRFRFDDVAAGHYTLEAAMESASAPCPPDGPCVGTALTVEPREFDVRPGDVHREDFGANAA